MDQLGREEFIELFLEAHPRLWTIAVAIVGDRGLAEDVVQDSAIIALDRIASFKQGTNFQAWISQIVRFTSLNYLKQRRRRNIERSSEHIELEEATETPQHFASMPDQTEEQSKGAFIPDELGLDDEMAAAIAQLPPERRICLLLRIVQVMSYDEIATMLDIPASTAMSHVHRAKATLKRLLQGDSGAEGSKP